MNFVGMRDILGWCKVDADQEHEFKNDFISPALPTRVSLLPGR